MFKADGERRDFPIEKTVITIGRKHTCDLRIPLGIVSREHCQVEVKDDQLHVRDLGSSNGTYHNSERVQEATLEAGDTLVIGPVHFTVVVDGQPAEIAEPVKTVLPEGTEEIDKGKSAAPVMAMIADEDDDVEEIEEIEAVDDDSSDVEIEDLSEAFVESSPPKGVEIEEPADPVASLDEEIEDVVDPTIEIDLSEEEDPIAALEALAALDQDDDEEEDAFDADEDDEDEEVDVNDALSFLQQEAEEHEEKHG